MRARRLLWLLIGVLIGAVTAGFALGVIARTQYGVHL